MKLWVWLAFLNTIKGGARAVVDEVQSIDGCLAFRAGDYGTRDAGATDANVRLYLEALGRDRVAAWPYWRPNTLDEGVRLLRGFHALGVRRFILNPEVEWKPKGPNNKHGLAPGIDNNALAREHVERLRREFPDCQLDYAPFALAKWHADYPFRGFSGLDACIPQLYGNEFNDEPEANWWARYREQYAWAVKQWPEIARQPWYPMCSLYGSDLGRVWGGMKPPGKWTVDDLDTWLAGTEGDAERHVYTIDAAMAEGAPWQALKRWRQSPPPKRRRVDAPHELQRALAALGHDPGKIDGIVGPNTRAALSRFASSRALSNQPASVVLAALEADYHELANLALPPAQALTARDVVRGLFPDNDTDIDWGDVS